MKRKLVKAVALTMGAAMSMSTLAVFAGCGGKTRALVIMTDALNELFSPFYSTAGSDMGVVGETQISMFTTDPNGSIAVGEDEACVTLAWDKQPINNGARTEYYFVIKNDIVFSDGVPLTMNDVLFNMYVYLDPAFTGSSTMYSTDIVGLAEYRSQSSTSPDSNNNGDDSLNAAAIGMATSRMNELIVAYQTIGYVEGSSGSYNATPEKMRAGLAEYTPSTGYRDAIDVQDIEKAREQLIKDYNDTVEKFDKELDLDYEGAKEAYVDEPYDTVEVRNGTNGTKIRNGFDEVISFMYTEGYATTKYARDPETNEYDMSKIEYVELQYDSKITTKEAAIEYVRNYTLNSHFDQILAYWATGSQMNTEFMAKAKDILLHQKLTDGQLAYPNIEGIESLGHTTDKATVTIGNKEYKVAHEHNDDGTPVNKDEYDVLRITINDLDPKAEWNFGFTVAPYHYYSDPDKYPVNIKNNQFGVEWASFEFQNSVIQGKNKNGKNKNRLPLGAGPYIAADENGNTENLGENDFVDGGTVYYVRNERFLLGAPKIEKMQYRVVSSANALSTLERGEVHFVTPNFTKENGEKVLAPSYEKKGFKALDTWQLGYGYIGINAGFVKEIELRRAIMCAMDTTRARDYYYDNTCFNIFWPMSLISWGHPRTGYADAYKGSDPQANVKMNNGHDYAASTDKDDAWRKQQILQYMSQVGASEGDSRLKLKFTIAGSSLNEHPCYAVFLHAQALLNECGWDVEVKADTNALTKLATGSLAVWAAAWGSALDPDMYQIYHKNSTATSVAAWGYKQILANQSEYSTEYGIIQDLSDLIDKARTTDNKNERAKTYEEAMSLVLDLAVELPVYQRKSLYVMNLKVIDESTLEHDTNGQLLNNPYASPLNKIWNVELK